VVNKLPIIITVTTSYFDFCIFVCICQYLLATYCSFTWKYSRITICTKQSHIHGTLQHTNISTHTVHFTIQQNSFNLTSDFPAFKVRISKTGNYRPISKTCSKELPAVSVHQTLWYLLTTCSLVHQLLQLFFGGGGEDPEPADGDVQTEYSSDQLYSPSIGAVTKYYHQELRSV